MNARLLQLFWNQVVFTQSRASARGPKFQSKLSLCSIVIRSSQVHSVIAFSLRGSSQGSLLLHLHLRPQARVFCRAFSDVVLPRASWIVCYLGYSVIGSSTVFVDSVDRVLIVNVLAMFLNERFLSWICSDMVFGRSLLRMRNDKFLPIVLNDKFRSSNVLFRASTDMVLSTTVTGSSLGLSVQSLVQSPQ